MKKIVMVLVLYLFWDGPANSKIIKLTKCDSSAEENYSISKKNYEWDKRFSFNDIIINTEDKQIKTVSRESDEFWEDGRKWRDSIEDKEIQEMLSRRIRVQTYNLDYFDNNFATGKVQMSPGSNKHFFFIEIDLVKKFVKTWSSPIPSKSGKIINIPPSYILCQ
jgi:hypothetical protein